MASTPLLGLSLPADGTTNWGTLVNTSITSLIDSAVAGTTTISSASTPYILTATTEAANESRQAVIFCTGARAGVQTIIAQAPRPYVIINATTGGFGVNIAGTGPTTGVTIPAGKAFMVAWNGSDFVTIGVTTVNLASDVTGILPVANGGTGQSTYTDGQLLIGNSTGNTLTKATLTAGSGVAITNGGGSISISATGSGGTVTGVTGTSPVVSSGGAAPAISLAAGYGDTLNPYASKTANSVLAAPNGSAGVPSFRALVAADIPTLNQNTSGTAGGLSSTLVVGSGGTGQTTYTDGQLLIGNSTGGTLTKATLSTSGTGLTVTNGSGSITLQNTAPDQTVALTGAGGTTISGTYPNFTITSTNTTYSTATDTTNGLIKLGSGTVQGTAANAVTSDASRTYALQLTSSGQAVVNVPWTGGSGGSVTGVTATSPVASSGGTAPVISLNAGYGDTLNPYASKTASHFLAAPNGSAGVPSFRAIAASDIPVLNQNTTGSAATAGTATNVTGVVAVANGGTNLSSYTTNAVLYASGTGTISNSSNFVFDGTNVGIGASTPSTYGKFVVGGTGSFANALVSTSTTLTDKPTLEFRKTATGTTSGVTTNQIGRISFYSQSGSSGTTTTESAYIKAEEYRVSNIGLSALKLATYVSSVSVETNYVDLSTNGLFLYASGDNGIQFTGDKYVFGAGVDKFYVDPDAEFAGAVNVGGALTVATVPVVTTTGSQTLTNKTLASNTVATTQTAGDNSTKVATTAFVQTAIGSTGATGTRGQAFTANGTFTIPAGVTAVKITVVGGGGGGSNGSTLGCAYVGGTGGGGGGTAQSFLTSLTPGNTLSVTVGAAGAANASGGNSTVASGTQTISTITGGGGSVGTGGTASGGTLNSGGGAGGVGAISNSFTNGGSGGSSMYGGGGVGGNGAVGSAGRLYGGGGGGGYGNLSGAAGAAGVVIFEW